MSGHRTQPYKSQFDSINDIPPLSMVYVDSGGMIRPLEVGNNLQLNNGVLNVVLDNNLYISTFAANIGSGTGLYSSKVGDTLQFKSIVGSAKLFVTQDADSVTLTVVNAADINHIHYISDVVGLQTALDGKSSTSHLHDDRYTLIGHTHTASNITDFSTAVDARISAAYFTSLADTPNTYTSNAGKLLAVKSDESGVEFVNVIDGGTF